MIKRFGPVGLSDVSKVSTKADSLYNPPPPPPYSPRSLYDKVTDDNTIKFKTPIGHWPSRNGCNRLGIYFPIAAKEMRRTSSHFSENDNHVGSAPQSRRARDTRHGSDNQSQVGYMCTWLKALTPSLYVFPVQRIEENVLLCVPSVKGPIPMFSRVVRM